MNILIMLVLISLLVLVHELGHYLAARAFGVQVSRFGFGLPIGPTLYEKKCGDTIISVHAFLLGGYVSFPDDDEENDDAKALPSDSPKRFKNKASWQKAIIVSAGVFMNVVFAIFLVMFCAIFYQKLPSGTYDVYVAGIADNADKTILNSGLKEKDKIIKVNGNDISSSYQLIYVVSNSKTNDGFVDKTIVDEKLIELQKINPTIKQNAVVNIPKVTAEKPFSPSQQELMGLEKYKNTEVQLSDIQKKLRDEIQSGKQIKFDETFTLQDVAFAISDSYKPVTLTVLRDGKELEFKNLIPSKEGYLGVKLATSEVFREIKSPLDVITVSSKYLYDNTKLMVLGLVQLVTGKIPMSDMHGIVAITKVGGDIIENYGMLKGLLLAAIISIDLALINLLPIPALDGGHLMFLAIEKITGKELDEKVTEGISKFFFILLILLMVYVVFNDIFALITKQL